MNEARALLRAATAAHHERVDHLFGRLNLSRSEDYARFLLAQSGPLIAVEAELDRRNAAQILEDWPERRRAHLLRDDLARLGLVAEPIAAAPPLAHPAEQLGAIYVLEGSRFGGASLIQSLASDAPRSFLGSPHPRGAWLKLLERLDEFLYPAERIEFLVQGARNVFESFEAAGRRIWRSPARDK